jgi:hypothetical protein
MMDRSATAWWAKTVFMSRPRASRTVVVMSSAPSASASASVKPSPPSAIGTSTHSASGNTARIPRDIAAAAMAAVIDSLKESGARTNFIVYLRARGWTGFLCPLG